MSDGRSAVPVVLDYAVPPERRGWGRVLAAARAAAIGLALVVSWGGAIATVAWACKLARLWAVEVGSGCGTVRLAIKSDLITMPLVLPVIAIGLLVTAPGSPERRISRAACLAAAAAWATVFVWVHVQR